MKLSILKFLASLDRVGVKIVRTGIVIVFLWIGGLKFFSYEADGIVPFVANSPFMSFFYSHPSEYKKHVNKEGELKPANHFWQIQNGTYVFSFGLGIYLVVIALLVAAHRFLPLSSTIASMLIVVMTAITLSFLITTPESWVPALGDTVSGFPFLSARGRLILKDVVIMGGAIITMSDSAKLYLRRQG
jgi:uncharacterized membrane protein YkgB